MVLSSPIRIQGQICRSAAFAHRSRLNHEFLSERLGIGLANENDDGSPCDRVGGGFAWSQNGKEMRVDADAIKETVMTALHTLYDEEAAILQFDIGERTICACLAAILKRSFDEHSVHVEYNRRGVAPKDIEYPDSNGILVQHRVFPDIIVHQPGHDDANLLVLEVKKTTNPAPDELDIKKLDHIKRKMSYAHAVFLRLPTGEKSSWEDFRLVVV